MDGSVDGTSDEWRFSDQWSVGGPEAALVLNLEGTRRFRLKIVKSVSTWAVDPHSEEVLRTREE